MFLNKAEDVFLAGGDTSFFVLIWSVSKNETQGGDLKTGQVVFML